MNVYTDGSTDPRGLNPNSGVGIFVTDEKHREIWQGGFHLLSDGNNFLAEVAVLLPLSMRFHRATQLQYGLTRRPLLWQSATPSNRSGDVFARQGGYGSTGPGVQNQSHSFNMYIHTGNRKGLMRTAMTWLIVLQMNTVG